MHALSKEENQMQWESDRLHEPSLAKWRREWFETAFDDNHIGQGLERIWLNSVPHVAESLIIGVREAVILLPRCSASCTKMDAEIVSEFIEAGADVWPLWCDFHLRLLLSEEKMDQGPRFATLSLAALFSSDLGKSGEYFDRSIESIDKAARNPKNPVSDEAFLLAFLYLVSRCISVLL